MPVILRQNPVAFGTHGPGQWRRQELELFPEVDFLIYRNPFKNLWGGGKLGLSDRFRLMHWQKSHRYEERCLRKLLVKNCQNG